MSILESKIKTLDNMHKSTVKLNDVSHDFNFQREFNLRGLSKKFVEFVNKNKSTSVVALKLLHV